MNLNKVQFILISLIAMCLIAFLISFQSIKAIGKNSAEVMANTTTGSAISDIDLLPAETILPIVSTQQPTYTPAPITGKEKIILYTTTGVNVRKGPGLKYKIVGTLVKNSKVKQIKKYKNWTKVKIEKRELYISNKYLTKKKPKKSKKAKLIKVVSIKVKDKRLSKAQRKRAETIIKTTVSNWDKYGVLPSVALAQAMNETTLGKAYDNGNLWGISTNNYAGYDSVEDGTYAYMKVINNGSYKGAPGKKNYKDQLRAIVNGGYCEPPGQYYSECISHIKKYDFDKYDKLVK